MAMTFRCAIVLFVALCCVQPLLGCHWLSRRRGKRQADESSSQEEIGETEYLRFFLTECLENKAGDIWDWRSVVDVTILDSFWYTVTDELDCGVKLGQDTVDCWKTRLGEYIYSTSQIYIDTVFCINLFAVNVSEAHTSRKKRANTRVPYLKGRCSSDYHPNSERTRAFTECNSRSVELSSNRDPIDFGSISQFVAQEAVCGPEFPNCGPDGLESITSENDTGIPRWPYTLEALLKPNSPVRASVFECNNRIFSLNSPDRGPACQNWGAWSSCSGCQRSRSRSRSCREGHTGQTSQQADCRPPPSCQRPRRPNRQRSPLCQLILYQAALGNNNQGLLGGLITSPANSTSVRSNGGLLVLLSILC